MDNNDESSPFTDIQSPGQDPSIASDRAFSDNVGSPTGLASPPSDQLGVTPSNASGPELKHKAPVGAIILAIIVAGVLAAATVYAYRQSNKPVTNQQTSETSDKLDETDVDKTSEDVDNTVNEMDSASDFVESELSDTTLGL